MVNRGKLYLIPVPLGEVEPEMHLPPATISAIQHLEYFIAEDTRSARRFLVQVGFKGRIDDLTFFTLNKHTNINELSSFLQPAMGGSDIGLLSEAGSPCIADPGALVVELAHKKRLPVVPLIGPSSILLALIAAGFNGQEFSFHGYLPKDRNQRIRQLVELEKAMHTGATQIFMEVPFRNNHMIEDILKNLNPETRLCIAADLTLDTQFIKTQKIKTWRDEVPDLHKRPAIFILG